MSEPKRFKLAIVHRSFWPNYAVIGEALLRLAEDAAKNGHGVSVIFRDPADALKSLKDASRGEGVSFYPIKARTSSASSFFARIVDSIFFAFWVCVKLWATRHNRIYVSTDPPVLVPFVVMVYCKLFRAVYFYHLQDIHPEATNVAFPINKNLFRILVKMDSTTMDRAERLITITKHMSDTICTRSARGDPPIILSNPAILLDFAKNDQPREAGFAFCGNAGRMQLIPLVLDAIDEYFTQGGTLKFTFAGGGIYAERLQEFANRFELFSYRGLVDPLEAAKINAGHTWALLPIKDEVTKYAFPSKISSYLLADNKILAICGSKTSVAQWINHFKVGIVVEPEIEALISTFFAIENGSFNSGSFQLLNEPLKQDLDIDVFVAALGRIVLK